MNDITSKSDITIKQAMKKLNQSGEKCLVIVDDKKILLGTFSDGDLRKAILSGAEMTSSIEGFYQNKPTVLKKGKYNQDEAKSLFTKNKFDLIPVINDHGVLKDILLWENIFNISKNDKIGNLNVPVVVMAGGQGTRLEPFTKILPKPLIPVNEKSIIEHIIERFTKIGCLNFFFTINYKGKILKAYFEEIDHKYNVEFIEEKKPLGTAGSLQFIKGIISEPFFVTNCDIIIKTNYESIYNFHVDGCYDITLIASAKEYVIPYGTCTLNDDGHLSHIIEKPKYDFLINTGLYVLNPDILELIPKSKTYHITHLIKDAKKQDRKIGVFPIDEDDWVDIGQWAEYKKAIEIL